MTIKAQNLKFELGAMLDLYEMDASAISGPTYRWVGGAHPTGYYVNRCLNPNGEGGTSGTTAGWATTGTWGDFAIRSDLSTSTPDEPTELYAWFGSGWTGTPAKTLRYNGSPTAAQLCVAGDVVLVQADVVTYHTGAELRIEWRDGSNAIIGDVSVASIGERYWAGLAPGDGTLPSDYLTIAGKATAPAGTAGFYPYIAAVTLGTETNTNTCALKWRRFIARPMMSNEVLPTEYQRPSLSGGVVFNGLTYTPLPIRGEGFERTSKGAQPRPKIYVPNIEGVAAGLAIAYGDLLGAKVTRRRTFEAFLDRESTADPTACATEIYYIDRKASQDADFVVWELASILDLEGRMIPRRQIIKNICPYTYRFWNGSAFVYGQCQYTGGSYFTITGSATTADQDVCGRRLSDCKLRFGANAELPYGGFPGVGNVRFS